jgi:hypothetical protein
MYPIVNRQAVLAVAPVGRLHVDHFKTISAAISARVRASRCAGRLRIVLTGCRPALMRRPRPCPGAPPSSARNVRIA